MNLPQIRLEPLLKARAEELSPGRIMFGHQLTDLQQDEHGVQALIRDNASDPRPSDRSLDGVDEHAGWRGELLRHASGDP